MTDLHAAMPAPGEAVIEGIARRRDTRLILARVLVVLRVGTIAPMSLAIVRGVRDGAYSTGWLAVLAYAVLAAWGAVFLLLTVQHGRVSGPIALADAIVVAGCVLALGLAVHPWFFVRVNNSDLEPAMYVAGVVTAVACSARQAVVATLVLASAHVVAEIPAMAVSNGDIIDTVSDLSLLGAAVFLGRLLTARLLEADELVDSATWQVLVLREQIAEERGRTKERFRSDRDLHDGPLSFVTTVASGELDHLGMQGVKRQCAIKAELWRALASDGSARAGDGLLVALTEVGTEFAPFGLEVVYRFGEMPTDLPDSVAQALTATCREALNNVVRHAETDQVVLTAVTDTGPDGVAVTVSVVDQGKGFDPATIEPGRGVDLSIIRRMREAGGEAIMRSYPGEGTVIELRWPR